MKFTSEQQGLCLHMPKLFCFLKKMNYNHRLNKSPCEFYLTRVTVVICNCRIINKCLIDLIVCGNLDRSNTVIGVLQCTVLPIKDSEPEFTLTFPYIKIH